MKVLIQISTKFVSDGHIDNKLTLFQVIVCRLVTNHYLN